MLKEGANLEDLRNGALDIAKPTLSSNFCANMYRDVPCTSLTSS
jgi:hypothetical protein